MQSRLIYLSPNGDKWSLASNGVRVFIRHEANPSSGGTITDRSVGEFLMTGGQGPEKQELLRLIASLADASADAIDP